MDEFGERLARLCGAGVGLAAGGMILAFGICKMGMRSLLSGSIRSNDQGRTAAKISITPLKNPSSSQLIEPPLTPTRALPPTPPRSSRSSTPTAWGVQNTTAGQSMGSPIRFLQSATSTGSATSFVESFPVHLSDSESDEA
mmetsp:Transcript_586/g.1707  ORF Transcript_586/g.1707 Transcript_586/m.1707 type:complete len:141 (+) Transcript_586:277-699(+)